MYFLSGLDTAGWETGEFRREMNSVTAAQYLEFLNLAVNICCRTYPDLDLQDEYRAMLALFLHGLAQAK